MAGRGCVVPERARRGLAVLPVAHVDLHRPTAAPDRRADQHRERPERPDRGLRRRSRGTGTRPEAFNLALQRSGYTTGFVGKYLNGYDADHGARRTHAAADGAGLGPLRRDPGRRLPGVGLLAARSGTGSGPMRLMHDAKPPRNSPTDVLDAHYATNVESRRRRRASSSSTATTPSPTSSRWRRTRRTPSCRRPIPTTRRSRPRSRTGRRKGDPTGGNCGTKLVQPALAARPARGTATRAPTTRRRTCTATAPRRRRRRGTSTRSRSTASQALREYRNRARMVQAVDRMIGRIRAAVGPNTYVVLTSDNGYHLGQLQLNGGQGHAVRLRHAGAAGRRRSAASSRDPRRQFVSNIDLAPDLREAGRHRHRRPRSPALSFAAAACTTPAPGAAATSSTTTPTASPQPGEVDNDTALGGDLEQIPSYIGVRGRQGLLVRVRPRRLVDRAPLRLGAVPLPQRASSRPTCSRATTTSRGRAR